MRSRARSSVAIVVLGALVHACNQPPETIGEKCVAAMEQLEECGIVEDPSGSGYDEGCQRLERAGSCDQEISRLWSCYDVDEPCCSPMPGACCFDELMAYQQCATSV